MLTTKTTAAVLAATLVGAAGIGVVAGRTGGREPSRPAPTATHAAPGPDSPADSDPRTEELMKRLDEPLMMNFPRDTPLEDVLKFIKQATATRGYKGIPIHVDPIGLSEAEKTVSSPVTIEVEGVPLRRSLQLLLERINLVYYVQDGLLVITSEERARFGLPPEMATPSSRFREEIAKATRGDMSVEEMETLTRKIKLIDEIRRAVKTPEPTARRGGFR